MTSTPSPGGVPGPIPTPPQDAWRADGTGAAATTGGSVLSGSLWRALSLVLPQGFTLIISVVAARALGPDGMGQQSFISFMTLSLVMVLSAGVASAILRFVGANVGAGRADLVRGVIRWGWRLEVVAAGLGATVLLLMALRRAELQGAWALAAVGAATGALHAVPSSVLGGLQRWREASVVGLVTGFVGTVATVAVLLAGGGIVGIFAVEAVVSFGNLLWTTSLARRAAAVLPPGIGPIGEIRGAILRYAALEEIGTVLTFVVWKRSEFFFLDRYSADAQIAVYSIAFAAFTALVRIPEAMSGALFPAFATLSGAGAGERVRAGFSRAARLSLMVAIPLAAGAAVLAPIAVRAVYGDEYDEAGRILLVLLIAFPVIPVMGVSDALTGGLALLRVPLIVGGIAAALNLALNAVLVPRFDAMGAAVANTAAQVAVALPMVVYAARRAGGVHWHAGALARMVVAAAACAGGAHVGAAALGGGPGLVSGTVLGMATLLAALVVLRPVPADDAAWLEGLLAHRLPPSLRHRVLRLLSAMAERSGDRAGGR